jgi:hypothetical protein
LHTLAKCFYRCDQAHQLCLPIGLDFQLARLHVQGLTFPFQFLPPVLILRQGYDLDQIGLRQALDLVLQIDSPLTELFPAGLKFLRQPVLTVGSLQSIGNALWMGQHLTEILPNQCIELMGGNVA